MTDLSGQELARRVADLLVPQIVANSDEGEAAGIYPYQIAPGQLDITPLVCWDEYEGDVHAFDSEHDWRDHGRVWEWAEREVDDMPGVVSDAINLWIESDGPDFRRAFLLALLAAHKETP